jgi:cellulose synthase/poly-beta-1,6-N-acetylglucosamine synthase-like glycosyltransferase
VIVATALLIVLAAFLLLPALADLVSLVRALTGTRSRRAAHAVTGPLPRLLFLVPAHNEELAIATCLRSLAAQRYPADRRVVSVVADNCTDRTAAITRAGGASCLERMDPARPGKPHAIAWALERLELQDIDAIVIVDADTVVNAEFAAALARRGPLRGKVVQAYNDVSNRTDNALTRMAAVLSAANHRFAFGLKNRVGLNVPLSTGWCLGADVLQAQGWRAFSICEDWETYAQLTAAGVPIESAPDARILAQEAQALNQSMSQRKRWMAGKWTVLGRNAGALLRSRGIGAAQKLDCLAELIALGPATQLGIAVLAAIGTALLQPPGTAALVIAFAASLVRPVLYAAAAVRVDPEPRRALAAFAYLPIYTAWRLVAAVRALGMLGDQPWIRTERRVDQW